MPARELVSVLDSGGQPTGEVVSRDEAHKNALLHRVAALWVVRWSCDGGEILFQEHKGDYRGKLAPSAGGHVLRAVTNSFSRCQETTLLRETSRDTAHRELREELGDELEKLVADAGGATQIGRNLYTYSGPHMIDAFAAVLPQDCSWEFKPTEEVSRVYWRSAAEANRLLIERSDIITPGAQLTLRPCLNFLASCA